MKLDIKKYVSPVFLALLFISFVMWYLTKLSYTYTAEVPVWVEIEGNRFKVECMANGPGYRILAHRTFGKSKVAIELSDVETTVSPADSTKYNIIPLSLMHIISVHNNDIKIMSIGDIPEITVKR